MFASVGLYAQNYKTEEECSITIKPRMRISSSTVKKNEVNPFFAVESAPDKALIGCHVYCEVLEVRKSNLSGSEGRLRIRPMYIKKDNEKISVTGDIYVRGKNWSNMKFFLSLIPFFWIKPGEGAYIYGNDRFTIYLR